MQLVLVSLLALCGLTSICQADKNAPQIEEVCVEPATKFTLLSQVRALSTKRAASFESTKCDLIKPAVKELQETIAKADRWGPCSAQFGHQLRALVGAHMGSRPRQPLPVGLQTFTRQLGLGASSLCKIHLVYNLARMDMLLTGVEQELIKTFESAGVMLFEDEDLSNNVIPATGLMVAMLREANFADPARDASLSPATVQFLKRYRAACNYVLSSIYDEQLASLFELADMKLDYPLDGRLLSAHRERLAKNQRLKSWLNTMLLCEAVMDSNTFKGSPPIRMLVTEGSNFERPELPNRMLVSQKELDDQEANQEANDELTMRTVGDVMERLGADRTLLKRYGKAKSIELWMGIMKFIESRMVPQ